MADVEHKNAGNKALLAGNYEKAIEEYTKAIDINPKVEVYFANRAMAYLKTEAYGFAVADATEAIKLNPDYVKAYYRRATAHTAIIKHKDALVDFKIVVEKAPNDRGARERLVECQKMIRRLAFERAIAVDDVPSIADSIDVRSMTDDADYTGEKLDIEYDNDGKVVKVNVTKAFISELLTRFTTGKLIPRKYVFAIVIAAMRAFASEPTMVEVNVEPGQTMTVCGDTHGQLFDLLHIFETNGQPNEKHMYLFNGDFVDRGSWSTEIAILLFSFKLAYPNQFFLNRGNHETDDMNKVYGFEGECKAKYQSEKIFKAFSEAFSNLPLATLIGEKYLVLHGGLFSDDAVTLEDIRRVDRFNQKQPGQQGLMMEMLWTDPQDENGRGPSKRGVGIQFGPDVTKRFCDANNLNAVIRSHEVRMGGYSEEHDGRLITVFSAPNYCDSQGNKGAYINIENDYKLNYVTFDAVPHPDVKPMAYASSLMM